jgi:hypothetical protein
MQRELTRRARRLGGVSATSLLAIAAAASAAGGVTATSLTRTHSSALKLGRAMMANPAQLTDAIFQISPPGGSARVLVHGPHEAVYGFPRKRGDFAVLSNGCGVRFDRPKYKGDPGCDDSGPLFRGTRDTTIMRLTVNVPKSATCLSFRFRFLSNEYPTWVGSQYNDAFIAELDHSTWTSTVANPAVSAPDDFAKTADGHLITINATGVGKVSSKNATGTGYNAATRLLRASHPVTHGRHFLYLSIFDQGDRQYDSAVFVDGLTLDRRTPCKSGVAFDQS